MRERAVFVILAVVCLLTGLARFRWPSAPASLWLDAMFLATAAVLIALGVVMLGRGLLNYGDRIQNRFADEQKPDRVDDESN